MNWVDNRINHKLWKGFGRLITNLSKAREYRGGIVIVEIDLEFQSAVDLVKEACQAHPHLKVKFVVDCLEKRYISFQESADFMDLSAERWRVFLRNYEEADMERISPDLRNLVPAGELRFLTGLTDEQLRMLERALEVPFLVSEEHEGLLPLLQELKFLTVLGLILQGQHNLFKSYSVKALW